MGPMDDTGCDGWVEGGWMILKGACNGMVGSGGNKERGMLGISPVSRVFMIMDAWLSLDLLGGVVMELVLFGVVHLE